jgi:hypothetical protein
MMRVIQRKVEAVVGGTLIDLVIKDSLKKAELVQQKVYLPKHNIYMYYLERKPITGNKKIDTSHNTETAATKANTDNNNTPVLLFCHGLSGKYHSCFFVSSCVVVVGWIIPNFHFHFLFPWHRICREYGWICSFVEYT